MFISACSNPPEYAETAATFFEKSSQPSTERQFVQDLKAVQQVDLHSLDIFSPSFMKSANQYIFLSEADFRKVNVLDKDRLEVVYSFAKDEGSGPDEIRSFMHFDASQDKLALLDRGGLKILITDHDGNLINEFVLTTTRPSRLAFQGDDKLLLFSNITDDFLVNIVNLEGDILHQFVKLENVREHNPLQFGGRIFVQNDHFYFAGRPESILKKYTTEGELLFSKTTVDDWPSEHNYVTFPAGDDFTARRYSPGALWGFFNFDVWGDYIVALPHHNGDPAFTYIDIYSNETGDYIGTLRTVDYPNDITVDDQFLYVRESRGDVYTLKKYPNNLREWFPEQ
ncbi:MAG: hypothetical protein ACNA78_04175 [Balneolaceae bacterium]